MAYTVYNFKTKKELKEAVAEYMYWRNEPKEISMGNPANPKPVRCYQPGLGPDLSNYTGKITLEGPHYPKPHTWYAEAELKDGVVIKVK
jgi:hypothetical protein